MAPADDNIAMLLLKFIPKNLSKNKIEIPNPNKLTITKYKAESLCVRVSPKSLAKKYPIKNKK
jgi:hypothetical protein